MDRGIDTSTAAAFSSRATIDLRRNFERLIALFLITHLSQGADIVSGEIRHIPETLETVDQVPWTSHYVNEDSAATIWTICLPLCVPNSLANKQCPLVPDTRLHSFSSVLYLVLCHMPPVTRPLMSWLSFQIWQMRARLVVLLWLQNIFMPLTLVM